VSERTNLRGVAVTMSAERIPKGGWRVAAELGSPAAPLDLELAREREGVASAGRARVWLAVNATSSALNAALGLRVLEQTLAPGFSIEESLHAEVNLRFDTTEGRTEITVHEQAGDGAATAEASIEIPDDGDPIVRHAQGAPRRFEAGKRRVVGDEPAPGRTRNAGAGWEVRRASPRT